MSYQVLARKWRPAVFDDVVGQSHVVKALSNALDQDRVHHAFLFTGTRGVGKTTLARIFAKALNCEQGVSANPCGQCASCSAVAQGRFIDLIEVDAASRTKVEDTRDLLDNVQYAPTQGRYKVYLIDEVHMLSAHSFNALLKTLEEPPEHVKFLLATTDPQKLPMTVLSRCIQFSLHAIEPRAIKQQLGVILDSEKIAYEAPALRLIASAANGSLRDALSLLDQAIAYCNQQLSEQGVRDMLGLVDGQTIIDILDALALQDAGQLMTSAGQLIQSAQELKTALDDLLSYMHALALFQFAPEAIEWKGLDKDHIARLARLFKPEAIQLFYQIVLKGKQDFALAPDSRTGFEMVLLRLLAFAPSQGGQNGGQSGSQSGNKGGSNVSGGKPVNLPNKPAVAVKTQPQIARPVAGPAAGPAAKPIADLTEKSAEAKAAPEARHKVAEDAEPFLQGGLQNAALQAHLTDATALKAAPAKTEKMAAKEAVSAEIDNSNKAHGQDNGLGNAQEKTEANEANKLVDMPAFITDLQAWADFVAEIGLNGMARQLLVHMTPVRFAENRFSLKLDPRYSNLQSSERLQEIGDALQQKSGQTFKMDIELAEVDAQKTAAGVAARRDRESQAETRKNFKQDENVQAMVSMFDAKIDDSSIKPAN